MPPRKPNKKVPQKHELEAFAEQYDIYKDIYGDPIEMAFRIMAGSDDENVQLTAANMLMSYRYPKVKASEVVDNNKSPQMTFTINVAAPGQKTLERAPTLTLPTSK